MKRNYKIYTLIIICIIGLGLPSRIIPQYFPQWYVIYAGDFFWAMLVFFIFANLFKLTSKNAFSFSLLFAYSIEISQLFHFDWLQKLRSIKILTLLLGSGFLWSDIVAYTFGISLALIIDKLILKSSSD